MTRTALDIAPWWNDHRELAALARLLEAEGRAGEVSYALEKPWKFVEEHARATELVAA